MFLKVICTSDSGRACGDLFTFVEDEFNVLFGIFNI
jgi:hypothetical protein